MAVRKPGLIKAKVTMVCPPPPNSSAWWSVQLCGLCAVAYLPNRIVSGGHGNHCINSSATLTTEYQ